MMPNTAMRPGGTEAAPVETSSAGSGKRKDTPLQPSPAAVKPSPLQKDTKSALPDMGMRLSPPAASLPQTLCATAAAPRNAVISNAWEREGD